MKCLIIDPMHPTIIPLLQNIGIDADYQPDIQRKELIQMLSDYEGLIVRSKTAIDREIFDSGKNLKFIARAGAGMDQIDEAEALGRGIILFNASEGNNNALGEHALAILLALFNKICVGNQEVRNGKWRREENRGHEIGGKTIGIIGYGFMGKSFAKKLSGFDCTVLAYDKYLKNYGDQFATEATLEQIKENADILSFHIPLTKENKNLVDLNYLNGCKKNFWLVNTARGEILTTGDAIQLLKSGKILGAALDVLENEKLDRLSAQQQENFDYLINNQNVVFTPHVGGWTYESYEKINRVLVDKIKNSNII